MSRSFCSMKHLVVDISAHGFGHVAQTAAVLNEMPDMERLTIRTNASNEKPLRERLNRPFQLVEAKLDTGMIMYDALSVDVEATFDWYKEFHSNYSERRADEAKTLEKLKPDCLLSNIPYLSLDAAGQLGIPNLALCSLNWADVFFSYCQDKEGSYEIHEEIRGAYAQTDIFLQPTPSLPMEDIPNRQGVAPVARLGKKQPLQSTVENDLAKFVLVGLGGVALQNLPLDSWPRIDNVYWIWPDSNFKESPNRPDFLPQSYMETFYPYIDILASSDMVITKTGYGTQTEAVVNQVPTICISRPDWPEHPHLCAWHESNGEVEFCSSKDLLQTVSNTRLFGMEWKKPLVRPDGARQAANMIHQHLLIGGNKV